MSRGAVRPPFIEGARPIVGRADRLGSRGAVRPPFIEGESGYACSWRLARSRGAVRPPFIEGAGEFRIQHTDIVSGGSPPPLH